MSNSRYKTHRGREFNMSAFAEKNGDTRAVGNASLNARGDIIDAKGNVTIPSQQISRASANLKSTDNKKVSLKTDETILPVKNSPVVEDSTTTTNIVAQREVSTIDGPAIEVEYADGSIQVIQQTVN